MIIKLMKASIVLKLLFTGNSTVVFTAGFWKIKDKRVVANNISTTEFRTFKV